MATAVINQITERVTRAQNTTIDALTFTALSIVRVGLSSASTDYTATLDYKLTTDGQIDWSPPGKQPVDGATYFVTYTFQGSSSFKDFDQISDEMDVNMRALQPAATTQPGSVSRNLFIDLPATSLTDVYSSVSRVSSIQSLDNLSDFQGTELDEYGGNFDVVRGGATLSSGFVTFGAPAIATQSVLIPLGSRVSTLSSATQVSVYFKTTVDGTILPGQNFVTIPVEAEVAGAAGNVGSGTIVSLSSPILGISTVTNQNPTSGGVDQEADADYRDRIKASFLANDASTFRGIRRRALTITNVIDALVVGAGDPLLVRSGGAGGKVDLYIQAETGLDRAKSETQTYAGVDLIFSKQPVISVSSVLVNGVPLPSANYLLIKDTGVLTESVSAGDALRILGGASINDTITLNYYYNGVLEDVQTFFVNDEENDVPARDFLSRMATLVFIDVGCAIVLSKNADQTQVQSLIADAVAGYIDSLKLGAQIKYSVVYDLIRGVAGVDDVRPLETLARRGYGTAETVQLNRNEFPETGTISVRIVS